MRLASALIDLVLPQRCGGCAMPGGPLCRSCGALLAGDAWMCLPAPPPAGLPPPRAVARYSGAVRSMIVAYKERGRTALAPALAAALARSIRPALASSTEGGENAVLLVPVPSSRAAVRRRGRDPVPSLARRAADLLRREGFPVRCPGVLHHTRRVADQAGLPAVARIANLRGALAAGDGLAGRTVIVVDDVITTGATLAEAARALRTAGAEVPAVAVIAATPRNRS